MEWVLIVICLALMIVAVLYSSVGHGGASGYLAVLSLTTYGTMESAWLKQHAWSLNLVVAAIAFFHFHRAGHHVPKLTIPFIVASIPLAMVGVTSLWMVPSMICSCQFVCWLRLGDCS